MLIVAIDPGCDVSSWVAYDCETGRPVGWAKDEDNSLVLDRARNRWHAWNGQRLIIEQIAAMGMAVGAETFETVFWSGRFCEAWQNMGGEWGRVKRHEVKSHICHHPRAKDKNIRQALLDRWGGKDRALGKKRTPGPLYGMSGDCWAALAVAVTWADAFAPPTLIPAQINGVATLAGSKLGL